MMKATLPLAFDHRFPSAIWQLAFEQVADSLGQVVVELRNKDCKTITLVVLDLPEGQVVDCWVSTLPWRSALLGVWNGRLLYQQFDHERLPVPTALGCLELATRRVLWEWPSLSFIDSNGEIVWTRSVTEFDYGSTKVFRLATGERLETTPMNLAERHTWVQLPVSYSKTSAYWPWIDRFLKKMISSTNFERVDYLETKNKIIFSYYIHEKNHDLRTYLLVTDRLQTIWLHELIQQHTGHKGLNISSFCAWKDQLIAITDPTQLISYSLIQTP